MVNCSFCGYNIQKGTGLMFVKTDGKILHFCSRKCEVNTNKLGRNPRKVLWTAENRRLRSKESKK